ncbi:NADPH:quinone reductase-like Zn-dependent oxidoreductase [Psychromicrobium silvestre]|uniref:NADPH:quinone reductase-like Zn-dependent oxidoreductase n=1 Tax=Psychromicrobium silvestre TaxID=1645614 RepID=A0A7Y9LQU7_9MICC|nr:NADP-dependent oxidoreductase [Psychromicrobium silvestre]NYE93909.1 NADPH:quinone reductase-like Zn-dependent oxidoreductase [Psychromicrobium silvestre]
MRAISFSHYATDNSSLELGDLPNPKVGPGTLLVEVKAAGVNPVDWKVLAGYLDGLIDTVFPAVPGWDVAGVVRAVGPDTPEFAVGDEVMSYARKEVVRGGTFAELVAVPAEAAVRKPDSLSWEQAGALPLAGLSALKTLQNIGIDPEGQGKTVLIHGAAGGVGSLAVQIAVAAGARVIGTASERNHDYLRSLGAEPVSYGEGLVERVRALAPEGVDASADFVGGVETVTTAVLAEGGRHASIVDGSVLEHGGALLWARSDAKGLSRLAALSDAGKLKVEVAQTFGLDGVGEALDLSRSGRTRGKLVIVP